MPTVSFDRRMVAWAMPKTASTYFASVIEQQLDGYRVGKQHATCTEMFTLGGSMQLLQHVPFHYGSIRDPWSWYVSLYDHAKADLMDDAKKWTRRMFNAYVAAGRQFPHVATEIDAFVMGATCPSTIQGDIVPQFMSAITITPLEAPRPQHGEGLWSAMVRTMYADWRQDAKTLDVHADKWLTAALLDGNRPDDAVSALGLAPLGKVVNGRNGDKPPKHCHRLHPKTVSAIERVDYPLAHWLGYYLPFNPSRRGPLIATPGWL